MTGLGVAFIVAFIVTCVFLLLTVITESDDLFLTLALTAYIVFAIIGFAIIGFVMVAAGQSTSNTDETTEVTEAQND